MTTRREALQLLGGIAALRPGCRGLAFARAVRPASARLVFVFLRGGMDGALGGARVRRPAIRGAARRRSPSARRARRAARSTSTATSA